MMEKDKDPESQLSPNRAVEDASAKEAPPRVQAFWLFVWMIK